MANDIEDMLRDMGRTIPAPDKGKVDEIIAKEIALLLTGSTRSPEAKVYYVDFKERKLLATSS